MTLTQINKAGLDEIALDHVFTIGALGNASAYTFQGEGLNGTVNNPTLYLTRGKTYRFENGTGGHPIRIQSTSGANGTAYNTGVTNNGNAGTVIVEVQHDAPDTLYYQCTSHAAMNGILYITGALSDSSVTSAKIADGAIVNADINASAAIAKSKLASLDIVNADVNASAAIAGTKVSPAFGSQALSTSGTAATGALTVTGNITVSGTVDGVDVAALNTTVGNISTDVINDTSPQLGGTLDCNANDVQFTDGSGNVKILFDSSQDALEVADNASIMFGDHPDIELAYSNGNDFSIAGQHNGSGDIVVGHKNNAGNILKSIKSVRSTQAVELYHGDAKKAETTSGGLSVTGTLTSTSTVSDSVGNVRKVFKNEQSNAYTLVAADSGKAVGASADVTIPASVFSNGDMITIYNNSGSDIQLGQGTGLTMYNTGDASTGNRTLASRGMATLYFPAATTAYITGAGLS